MEDGYVETKKSGMSKTQLPDPCIVVIFGVSGDLTHRELIPSLYALNCKNLLPVPFAIIGFARREWNDDTFRQEMNATMKIVNECGDEEWERFSKNIFYVKGNFNDDPTASYKDLSEKIKKVQGDFNIPDNVLFHLATPPSDYGTIIKTLDAASLTKSETGWRRVIIEKPFGRDEISARELDKDIHKVFNEGQIFRVDHYLGKETVQNMLVFRFANPGFEPIWNRNYIDNVQITVAEDLGIGTRANFYEKTGILRDMVQNHLLQLLCITALEPPAKFDAESLRAETVKVLNSICKIDVMKHIVLGQYDEGEINGEKVLSYRQEQNVGKESYIPTFAALRIKVDNWRWADVPFYLRTGKRLKEKQTEVTIQFKSTPHLMFPSSTNSGSDTNFIRFQLQPNEGIIYTFMAKQPGAELRMQPVNLKFQYNTTFGISELPSSYQWLLFDAMKGDQTLFLRADWIYMAWNIIDPVIKKWETVPWLKLPNYTPGSWGPEEARKLIESEGRQWNIV